MRATELVKLLLKHGWYEDRQSGSHKTFKHSSNPKIITVPMHSRDTKKGLPHKILKIAGLE